MSTSVEAFLTTTYFNPGNDPQPLETSDTPVPGMAVAAAVACNALEFFDFVTYAFFAIHIGRAYFPNTEPQVSLLLSVAVFGVGFLARPLGGVIIGLIADRFGRRPALLLTVVLMTFGTLGLALTPSYASIGLAAPLIVTLCRLIQGFALGGEIGPSTSFLIEAAPMSRRAFYASFQLAGQGAATLAAGGLGLLLTNTLGPVQMADWGWRLPFLLGALLVPVALYLRWKMPETLDAMRPGQTSDTPPAGIQAKLLLLSIGVVIGGTVSTYVGNYMSTYAVNTLRMSAQVGMHATIVVGLVTLLTAPLGGLLADRIGRWPVMLWPRVAAAAVTVPAFYLLTQRQDEITLLCVSAVLATLTAISGSAVFATICELFPAWRRATALALTYSIGVSLFGGTTQLAVTWLIAVFSSPLVPAWYVVIASVIAVWASWLLPETRPSKR